MKLFLGIDPGLSGAVALVTENSVQLYDSPSWAVESKKGVKHEYNVAGMVGIIVEAIACVENRGSILAGLESVHSMPDQGVASSFKFGVGLGIWQGILAALGITYQMIPPQRWKKALMDGMGKEKDASMIVAQRLFPNADIHLRKHHGRADALLLAEFMKRNCNT
jgi:hypothetical protein